MTEELELLFKQYIRDNLRLDVKTQSVYNGGMDGGQMYTDHHCVQLILDDEVISEVSL